MKLSFALLFIFLLVGFSSFVFAKSLVFPFNQELDLKRPCFNNGTWCSTSAVCNVTVFYPDDSVLVNNQLMTNQISFHNFTITNTDINKIGIYSTSITCTDTGGDLAGNGFETFTFEVTGDGLKSSPFPIEFSVFLLGIVLIIVGKSKEDLRFFQFLGSILVLIMGVITLYPGYSNFNFANVTTHDKS